ncbi:MAG: AmmeMemoRadiSam system protein B [Nitrospirae bacterium]|nr:AmmeMemoRadiSam system protein B [Nitrospirota bacterium]
MRRTPAVAGQFYHASPSRLFQQVEQYITKKVPKEEAIAIVVPHAGLIYSGPVAGAVYSSIEFPKTFIFIGPNHTGLGEKISIMESGEWEIPTGVIQIDEKVSYRIALNIPLVTKDIKAHLFEHSLEVQLPFLTFFSKETKIVPIVIRSASIQECRELGEGIAKAVSDAGYYVIIAASSDMSHYVSHEVAKEKDGKAIEKILSLAPEGLYEIVNKEKISMCGYIPTTVALFAAKALGAKSAKLVKYSTSGEVSGDYEHVVGYAGIVLR